MNIWIVDDDVSFAYRIKKKLVSLTGKGAPLKVEVFSKPSLFFAFLKKNKKESSKKPHLVFLDIQMPEQNGLGLYLELARQQEEVLEVIHFCSSMSYGSFEHFFLERQMKVPPFVQKSKVEEKLEELVLRYRPDVESREDQIPLEKLHLPPPRARQLAGRFEQVVEKIRKGYYESGIADNVFASLRPEIEQISELAGKLSFSQIAEGALRLLKLFEQKTPAGRMRLRREIKDLLGDADKVLGKIKGGP